MRLKTFRVPYWSKVLPCILIMIIACFDDANAQAKYAGKLDFGYLSYWYKAVMVDAGPDWKSYNLPRQQSGIHLSVSNGLRMAKGKLYAGIGLGYLNFGGIDGLSVFTDVDYRFLRQTRLSPFIGMRLGYAHIWNQYEGGTGTEIIEFTAGVNIKLTKRLSIYLKSGIAETQQVFFIPVNVGLLF